MKFKSDGISVYNELITLISTEQYLDLTLFLILHSISHSYWRGETHILFAIQDKTGNNTKYGGNLQLLPTQYQL